MPPPRYLTTDDRWPAFATLHAVHIAPVHICPGGQVGEGEASVSTAAAGQLGGEICPLIPALLLLPASPPTAAGDSETLTSVPPECDRQHMGKPLNGNRCVIHASCSCAGVARGFTNLVVRKLPDGHIELDPPTSPAHACSPSTRTAPGSCTKRSATGSDNTTARQSAPGRRSGRRRADHGSR
jgi:hypothetical protein